MWSYKRNFIDTLSKYKYAPSRNSHAVVIDTLNSARTKLELVSQNLNVKALEDWYNVSQDVH
jgi:hypothetical protein